MDKEENRRRVRKSGTEPSADDDDDDDYWKLAPAMAEQRKKDSKEKFDRASPGSKEWWRTDEVIADGEAVTAVRRW